MTPTTVHDYGTFTYSGRTIRVSGACDRGPLTLHRVAPGNTVRLGVVAYDPRTCQDIFHSDLPRHEIYDYAELARRARGLATAVSITDRHERTH